MTLSLRNKTNDSRNNLHGFNLDFTCVHRLYAVQVLRYDTGDPSSFRGVPAITRGARVWGNAAISLGLNVTTLGKTNRGFNYRTVWRWVVQEGKSPEFVQKRGDLLWGKDQNT